MDTNRRQFLERLGATSAALAVLPSPAAGAFAHALGAPPALSLVGGEPSSKEWDTTWVRRLGGKYRALFDVPEVESGYGVWRASIWANQYADVLKVPARELSSAVVLRHNAIVLAMRQEYWDRYGVGAEKKVLHPITQQVTDRNPALLTAPDLPDPYAQFALGKYLERGGVVLACNLALHDVVDTIVAKDKVSPEEARKQALAWMVPGVILQPSGVFASLYAQDAANAKYIRAS